MAHFEYSSIISAPPEKVFEFITSPPNLANIMPPDYKLVFTGATAPFKKGSEYEFRLARYGVSVLWSVYIEEVEPNKL
ncbi:MAG: hypothetical protein ACHQVK_04995, partial [Candidatus Paceibacterales bacterium]